MDDATRKSVRGTLAIGAGKVFAGGSDGRASFR